LHINRHLAAVLTGAVILITAGSAAAQPVPAPAASAAPAAATMPANGDNMSDDNRYGGAVYGGAPDLATTAALVKAGGTADFSIAKALTAMVGPELANAEWKKLSAQYGDAAVASWSQLFTFAVADALKAATAAGVTLPQPAPGGKALAARLVQDGVTQKTFWTGHMLDVLVTHRIHEGVMDDINAAYGKEVDVNYHKITNQAMYDLARALGNTDVELSYFH
jgi:hypothetical protein